jgi:membrane-bound lytic murein transglycosylase MltF
MLQRLNLRAITICVVDKHDLPIYKEVEPQLRMAFDVYRHSHGRVAWISTFDPQDWETPGFAERVNKQLDETFRMGRWG